MANFDAGKLWDVGVVGTDYVPSIGDAIAAGADYGKQQGLSASMENTGNLRVLLWLIDVQKDFVFTPDMGATLSVPDAIQGAANTNKFIMNNIGNINSIAASLDTHVPYQIFFGNWWVNQKGEHPVPFTNITYEDIQRGEWTPIIEPVKSIDYVRKLEEQGTETLTIWPHHCMNGSWGHTLVPALSEVIAFHSAARFAQPEYLVKGTLALSENYSILEPEVKVPNHPMGNLNTRFLDFSKQFDLIYVAGQARTHCVRKTMRSAIKYFANSPDIIGKFRFLTDCTNNIPIPEVVKETDHEFARYASMGVKMVDSNMPIAA